MKIISWNVNGLRQIDKKGLSFWLKDNQLDIVCLQEIKASPSQLTDQLKKPSNFFSYFNPAVKKGYAGTAVYTKIKPLKAINSLGFSRFDAEGRVIRLDFSDFIFLNLYLPHGGRKKENMGYKLEVYDYLIEYLNKLTGKKVILAGDFNVAHQKQDLARPKDNEKNTMFTPQEREKISRLLRLGFTDTFRIFHQNGGNFTWWPYYLDARKRNLGWRLDYIFSSPKLTPKLKNAFILNQAMGSDHCPIGIEI